MPVKQDFFYEFMFPGTLAMLLGLWFVLRKPRKISDIQLPILLRESLKNSSTKPFFVLLGIGIVSSLLRPLLGGIAGMGFILYLFSDLVIIAGMYLYYSQDRRGVLYLSGAFFFRFVVAIAGGRFGELVFGLVCYFSILTVGYNVRLLNKILIVSVGLFLILVLQAAKGAYRTLTWYGDEEPSLTLLAKVYAEEASNPTKLFKPELLFTLTTRFNQGQLTALVLRDVPKHRPYQNGAELLRVAAGVFVPRLFWPDKPMMGGKESIETFTIYKLDKGTSMNIAPIGEAYGNFGRDGGIIFMFFYGWLIATIYKKLLDIAQNRPGMLVWLPSLMLYTVVVETDCISVFNGLIKQLFFIYFIYRLFKYLNLDLFPLASQEVIDLVMATKT